jgi:hypothetical protein
MSGLVEEPRIKDRPSVEERSGGRRRISHDVFVSYSHDDKPVADALVARLEQAGIRCWIAPRDVLPGRVWGEAIIDAIETSRVLVVVLSGAANHSSQVVREVERAVANEVVVVPFRIESIEPTGAMSYYLSAGHWLDAMTPPLEAHISRLVEVAQALLDSGVGHLAGREAGPPPPPPPPSPPPPPPLSTGAARHRAWLLPTLIAVSVLALVAVVGVVLLGPEPAAPEAERVALADLEPGMCLQTPQEQAGSPLAYWLYEFGVDPTVAVVPCESPHGAEVYAVEDDWADTVFPESDYPGWDRVSGRWEDTCLRELEVYVGAAWLESSMDFSGWFPYDAEIWNDGDRQLGCIAFDVGGEELVGSVQGTGR